jgi:xanthine dehydrogenase accessory factor
MHELLDTLDAWRAGAAAAIAGPGVGGAAGPGVDPDEGLGVGPDAGLGVDPDEGLGVGPDAGLGVGRAVVVRTFGSAPRPEGAVLLVADDGRIAGSVSGGCVEGAAAEAVLAARRSGRERVIRYGISDEQAWDVGLACGGTVDVLVSPGIPEVAELAARETGEGRGDGRVIVTMLPVDAPPPAFGSFASGQGSEPTTPLVIHEDGRLDGTLGDAAQDALLAEAGREALGKGVSRTVVIGGRQLFLEAFPVRPRLVVVGAVEVARTLVRLAKDLGYETVVIDGRGAFATPERFPDVDRLVIGWPDEVAGEIGLGPADAVAVLAHDVKFDEPAIVTALGRGCRYVGAVGSRRTQADRRARLLAAGVAPADLNRLRGPIGLDLGGRLPAEIALAIMAEVVAERRGGGGLPLRDVARAREHGVADEHARTGEHETATRHAESGPPEVAHQQEAPGR